MVLQSDQAFATSVQPPKSMDNFEISLLEQVKRWIKIKSGVRKIVCMCIETQNLKTSKLILFNSHILDKRRRMNLGMRLTMETWNTWYQKKKKEK